MGHNLDDGPPLLSLSLSLTLFPPDNLVSVSRESLFSTCKTGLVHKPGSTQWAQPKSVSQSRNPVVKKTGLVGRYRVTEVFGAELGRKIRSKSHEAWREGKVFFESFES